MNSRLVLDEKNALFLHVRNKTFCSYVSPTTLSR